MFEILLDVPAQKFLKKTDTGTTSRIIEAIEKLTYNAIPHDLKRIVNLRKNYSESGPGSFVFFTELIIQIAS